MPETRYDADILQEYNNTTEKQRVIVCEIAKTSRGRTGGPRGIRERDRCAENGGNPDKEPREWIKFQKLILHSSVTLVKRQGRESMIRDVSHGNPRNEKISSTPRGRVAPAKKRNGGWGVGGPRGSSLRY
ncbi:hypothetical protein K0M31_012210, partial [Melipona bicolor]